MSRDKYVSQKIATTTSAVLIKNVQNDGLAVPATSRRNAFQKDSHSHPVSSTGRSSWGGTGSMFSHIEEHAALWKLGLRLRGPGRNIAYSRSVGLDFSVSAF